MHIVEVRNVFTGEVIDRILFEDVSRAFEYAMTMNDTMRHTPLRYVFIN